MAYGRCDVRPLERSAVLVATAHSTAARNGEPVAAPDEMAGITRLLLGQHILAIEIETHVFGDKDTPLSLWFDLGASSIRLRGTGHGEGLTADDSRPAPYDMGESGRVEVRKLDPEMGLHIGVIVEIWLVFGDEDPVRPVGLRWVVAGHESVTLCHLGDELWLGRELDEGLGVLRYQRVFAPDESG